MTDPRLAELCPSCREPAAAHRLDRRSTLLLRCPLSAPSPFAPAPASPLPPSTVAAVRAARDAPQRRTTPPPTEPLQLFDPEGNDL